jgi:glycosyltransferase involved in cell wall biosynthesis
VKQLIYIKTKHFGEDSIGGAVAHTVGIINGFSDCGEGLEAYTDFRLDNVRAKQNLIKTGKLHGNLVFELISARKYYRNIIKSLKTDNVEFIYHRHVLFGDIGVRLKKKKKVPLVIEFNSSELDKWNNSQLAGVPKNKLKALGVKIFGLLVRNYIKIWEPKLLKNADMIVVVSKPLREILVRMGVAEKKITVLHNGVDPEVFQNNAKLRDEIRSKYGFDDQKTVIGFSGTFGTWHGIPELTEAILQIGSRDDIGYLLIGDGYYQNEMKDKLTNIANVIFPGRIPFNEMPAYLSACDILVVANSWNSNEGGKFFGSPTKLFEYMAMGQAIVASDLAQIGQILEHRKTAIMFPSGDSDALAEALLFTASSPELRNKLGSAARREAIKKYTWEAVASGIVQSFRELSKGSQGV